MNLNSERNHSAQITSAHRKEIGGKCPPECDLLKKSSDFAGFLVHDVFTNDRVVFPKLDTFFTVIPIFLGEIAVIACLALELDD